MISEENTANELIFLSLLLPDGKIFVALDVYRSEFLTV